METSNSCPKSTQNQNDNDDKLYDAILMLMISMVLESKEQQNATL